MSKNDVKKMTIEQHFNPEQQGQYIEVPFEMPSNAVILRVTYHVEGTESVIDLGVKDPLRIRGWSGGARKEFRIENHVATPGYLSGPLHEGKWSVLLGLYKIQSDGCSVQLSVEISIGQPQWLKGDLHTHTVHSDGQYQFHDVVSIASERELDFIALTDHNTVSQNYTYPRNTNILFIPGLELTTNYGHSNLLGIEDPNIDFRITKGKDEKIKDALASAKSKGAKIVLNHPHCPYCPWEWDFDVEFDWVEVWNGPWREGNEATLKWWHGQLCLGKRIVAVGGSDVHRPDPFVKHGYPTTWVYSNGKTVEKILEAIDQGHVFISYSPTGPRAELIYGTYMMGDIAVQREDQYLEVKLDQLKHGDEVKFISNEKVEKSVQIFDKQNLTEHLHISTQKFIRVEVWRYFSETDNNSLALASNPIYFSTSLS
ncbi:CehA/McbA family metallohydrolase [Metabacillus herbersteinensis]|uniref:CehA/McbA family metallohydrolase n=1 Tax=Metabacillus herbersteinensis TaxID=283816 RepID=A0ABV6GJJ9_9BACI